MKRQLSKGLHLLFSDVQNLDTVALLFVAMFACFYLIGFGA
ncbi:hypothetical protein AB1K62_14550 [Parasphingorhabdus sp. JC815]